MYESENASEHHPELEDVFSENTGDSNPSMGSSDSTRSISGMRARDLITDTDVNLLNIDALESKYFPADSTFTLSVWFENLIPPEIEAILPTTDAQLNYISFTSRLASVLKHKESNDSGKSAYVVPCEHSASVTRRRERFAGVMAKFLDLHEILKDA
uniref:ORF25 n=1 Tax=Human herpesvirus 3 TaxID=10335 RepID=A0A0F7GM75_HHV3|nr:ORF25 [Human alphaherpesvirus 3]